MTYHEMIALAVKNYRRKLLTTLKIKEIVLKTFLSSQREE